MKVLKLTPRSTIYPKGLHEIVAKPKQLYLRGELPPAGLILVGIVGSRRASAYGRAVTEQLAGELASSGVGIVSGLALGIDAIAHKAALTAGGYTLAVLGCGVDRVYPSTNRSLGEQILGNGGGIISEYDPGMPPLKQHFPARNRIIAGLCSAILVTEAAERSGALITASFALEQNREVLSVPGNITSPLSVGTNNLIKAGATAVTNADDVLAALDLERTDKVVSQQPLSEDGAAIIKLLAAGTNDSDELIQALGWDAARFNQTVTLMELSGKLKNLGSGKWIVA